LKRIYALHIIKIIDSVIAFARKNPTFLQICQKIIKPRFAQLEELDWALGLWGHKTKRNIWLLCTSKTSPILSWNVWMITVSAAERLGRSATFDELYKALQQETTYI
jgi:hypothetical protein